MNIFGSVESFHLVSNGTQGVEGGFHLGGEKREEAKREHVCVN